MMLARVPIDNVLKYLQVLKHYFQKENERLIELVKDLEEKNKSLQVKLEEYQIVQGKCFITFICKKFATNWYIS